MNLFRRKCLKGYGRPVGTRTPDLYRVKADLGCLLNRHKTGLISISNVIEDADPGGNFWVKAVERGGEGASGDQLRASCSSNEQA
jgi:hypothetical protein